MMMKKQSHQLLWIVCHLMAVLLIVIACTITEVTSFQGYAIHNYYMNARKPAAEDYDPARSLLMSYQSDADIVRPRETQMQVQEINVNDVSLCWKQQLLDHRRMMIKLAATACMVATIWGTTITTTIPILSSSDLCVTTTAVAKEMASGSGSRVNKDPESLLRYGLPIVNNEVRKLQSIVEDIRVDIGTKRKNAALDGVKKAKTLLASTKDVDKMKSSCRDNNVCTTYLDQIIRDIEPLQSSLRESLETYQGSEQERKALDDAYKAQKKVVDTITLLEEQMVPANYKVPVPDEYKDLPQLQGRATVEMTLVKATKGDTFDVLGATFPEAKLTMIIDGYSSPITAGNFIDLVQKGFYDQMPIQRSDGFVVQTGDPAGDAFGYVGKGSAAIGNGPNGERLIPLEIFLRGDKQPIYEIGVEETGRGGEATVLPFNSYGAMGWARDEYDVNSGSSQFFWLLFDSDLTPAGKNVLDGRYPCFGYVVDGAGFLQDTKEGDIIVSAKVTKGAQNLILPK